MNNRGISKLAAYASPLATLAFLSVGLGGCGAAEPGDVANSEPAATTSEALDIGDSSNGLQYFQACTENNTCPNPGKRYVAFGANGFYVFKSMTIGGSFPCTVAFFGSDPAFGTHKACYYANFTHDVDQNQSNVVSGPRTVAFGANGNFNFQTINGAYSCNTATFGTPGTSGPYACYTALPGYAWAVTEGSGSMLTNLMNEPIAFGANGRYFYRIVNGSIACNTGSLGDPIPNVTKQCFRLHAKKDADENAGLGGPPGVPVYGSGLNGFYLPGPSSNGICSNAGFNGDPDVGQQKHCFLPF